MEFVILGLLALQAMTVYEINKALENSISLFYSASFGSINAAIGRMLKKGWISGEEKVESGRNKKIFHLTSAGREAFQNWLGSEIEAEKVKDPALTRLFFMGMLPIEQRISVLERHIETLQQTCVTLQAIQEQANCIELPQDLNEVYACQMLTLQYGLDFYRFNIQWYQDLLDELRKKNPAK